MIRLTLAAAAVLLLAQPAHAFSLIKEEEAKLPAAAGIPATRAITRGPGIKQIAPDATAGTLKSPLKLKLSFEPRGGAKIDVNSIRLTYLKATPVDLTDRVKHGVSDGGIELSGAEVPPGEHEIQVSVQDTEGRKGNHTIRMTVAK